MGRRSEAAQKALLAAETGFICDPDRRPVEFFHEEHAAAAGVDLDQTRKYARDQRWLERRTSFWQGVQAAWLRGRQVALLRSRATELSEAQDLRNQIYQMLRPRMVDGVLTFPIEPKSFEGLVTAFIKLDDLIDNKRDSVLSMVDPMLGKIEAGAQSDETTVLPFSGDEMRRLAHQLLQARRKKRQEHDADEHDADADAESGDGPGEVEGKKRSGGHQRAE